MTAEETRRRVMVLEAQGVIMDWPRNQTVPINGGIYENANAREEKHRPHTRRTSRRLQHVSTRDRDAVPATQATRFSSHHTFRIEGLVCTILYHMPCDECMVLSCHDGIELSIGYHIA